jgi:predicted nucleic acid-binding protein
MHPAPLQRRVIGTGRWSGRGYTPTLERGSDRVVTTELARLECLDRPLFDLATQLRVRHRLKTPDALHLAAALHSGCVEFWTNDDRLANAAQDRLRLLTWANLPA